MSTPPPSPVAVSVPFVTWILTEKGEHHNPSSPYLFRYIRPAVYVHCTHKIILLFYPPPPITHEHVFQFPTD